MYPNASNDVSIHARVERATALIVRVKADTEVSIHARVERATRNGVQIHESLVVSIHARVERATAGQRGFAAVTTFQSTHA